MNIITRKEAKENGLKRYFTGKYCPYEHISERMVSNSGCIKCAYEHTKEWWDNNIGYMTKYREENPEYREREREYGQKYCKENPGKNAAKTRKRKASKLHRTPPWVD